MKKHSLTPSPLHQQLLSSPFAALSKAGIKSTKELSDLAGPKRVIEESLEPSKYNVSDEIAKKEGASVSKEVFGGEWDFHRKVTEQEQLMQELRLLQKKRDVTIKNLLTLIDQCAKAGDVNHHEVVDYILNNQKRIVTASNTAMKSSLFSKLGEVPTLS